MTRLSIIERVFVNFAATTTFIPVLLAFSTYLFMFNWLWLKFVSHLPNDSTKHNFKGFCRIPCKNGFYTGFSSLIYIFIHNELVMAEIYIISSK